MTPGSVAGAGVFPAPLHRPDSNQPHGGNGANTGLLLITHSGDTDLDFRYARLGQRLRYGKLLVEAESNPGGLLAVAQRGIVDDDGRGHGLAPPSQPQLLTEQEQPPVAAGGGVLGLSNTKPDPMEELST